jgi:hypothetical protein
MSLSFEDILAEAKETVARNKARVGKPSKSAVRVPDDPAKSISYVPVRNVYLYMTTKCECGETWNELEGIYEDRQHTVLKHSHWVRLTTHPTNALPKGTEFRSSEVPYCKVCANAPTKVTKPESKDPCNTSTGDNSQATDILRIPG